jgi:hypothetical protein
LKDGRLFVKHQPLGGKVVGEMPAPSFFQGAVGGEQVARCVAIGRDDPVFTRGQRFDNLHSHAYISAETGVRCFVVIVAMSPDCPA